MQRYYDRSFSYDNTKLPIEHIDPAKRVCLCCQQKFDSKNKFNRMCYRCKENNKAFQNYDYSIEAINRISHL